MRAFLLSSVLILAAAPAFAAPPVGAATQGQLAAEATTARAAETSASSAASAANTAASNAGTAASAAQTTANSASTAVAAVQPSPQTVTAAGTTQATALAVPSNRVIVSSVPSGTGVILVTTIPETRIFNRDASNPLLVYPPTGGTIEGLAANAPVQINAGVDSQCTLAGSGAWRCSN